MASTRQKNPSLCNDIKALKGRPAKDSPGGVPGSCGQGWALPSSPFLLALEIGAGSYLCVTPVSRTPWELQGAASELLEGFGVGNGRIPWESSASGTGLALPSVLALHSRDCVSPESPKPAPVDVFDAQTPEHHSCSCSGAASPPTSQALVFCRSLFTPGVHTEAREAQIPEKQSSRRGTCPSLGFLSMAGECLAACGWITALCPSC